MWRFLNKAFKAQEEFAASPGNDEGGLQGISAMELAAFCWCASDRLIVFDLREISEVEEYPHAIPGALLTTHVDLTMLIPWIPPNTIVVLYGATDVPRRFARLRAPADEIKLYALRGGLRSWWQAGLPLEDFAVNDRKPLGLR
jgi:rhodanese-related sulfurtransferase